MSSFSKVSLFASFLVLISGSSFCQDVELTVQRFGATKCYAVTDSITGFFTPDSVLVYHGPFTEYNREKIFVDGNFNLGKKSGSWKKFYPNGKLCTKGMYVNDLPHGMWKYYYDTDTLSSVFYYNQGKKVGTWIGFAYNGKKQMTQEHDSAGHLICETFFYTNNGRVSRCDTISYSGQDSIVNQHLFYENGQLFVKKTSINDKTSGTAYKYYSNGKLWEELIYKDNDILAVVQINGPTGKPMDAGNFKDGKGILKRYHMNGKLWEETTYNGDFQDYSQQYFNFSGVVYSRGVFEDGKPKGLWTAYQGGKKNVEIDFLDGHDHYRIRNYLGVGLIESVREYKNGLGHGEWLNYDSYGKVIRRRNYLLGYLNGDCKSEYSDFKITGIGKFQNGNPVGKWEFVNSTNDKFLYTLDYPSSSSFDTSGLELEDSHVPISSWCQSEYDYQRFKTEDSFYTGDQNCLLWNPAENRIKRMWEGAFVPTGVIEVDFKIGLMGEVYDLKTRRSFSPTEDVKIHSMVYNFPFLKPAMYGGIPVEKTSSFIYEHEFTRPK